MEKYTAIITDPRIHPAWKLVLNNFLTNLDERWDFIILCGLTNRNFLIELIVKILAVFIYFIFVLIFRKYISIDF